MTRFQIVTNAVTGMTSSALALILPWQEQLDWGLRVISAAVFLLIGIISLHRLIRKTHY